jgi:hypothetical protein
LDNSFFEAQTLGVGRLLKDGNRFFVPHHQRDYLWTEDEIDQLFADIESARSANQPDYFIGLMVFVTRASAEFTILDGQQRMATTVIMLASIRTWLTTHGFAADAELLQSNYIGLRRLGKKDVEPRLVLNENNNRLFEQFVVNDAPSEDIETQLQGLKRYDPNRKLLEAVLFCRRKVKDIANLEQNTPEEAAQSLFDFVDYLTEAVRVVRVTVPNEANAYVVFETLNYRGVELSVLDLVKNYLFGKAGSAKREMDAQRRWVQMMANLADVPADVFLKVYWTSRQGRVQTAQLFPAFKQRVSSWKGGSDILDDMAVASELYAALDVADDPVWQRVGASRERVRTLRMLGARQVHPVLLSALAKFSDRELGRLLHFLEVLIVRYQLIGGLRTGRLEISCAALAHDIYRGDVNTGLEALRALKDILPSDNQFETAFREKHERNNKKARYLLQRLESQARKAAGKGMSAVELEPSGSLTVEHILPKKPGKEWAGVLQADPGMSDDCTYRLGNLCLLTAVNRDLGNKPFLKKKEVFARSDLVLTRGIAAWDEWNRQAIEDRQRAMAKLAVAAWRFP